MQKFTTKIVNMMKAEELYETQGGPIIMSQVIKLAKFISSHKIVLFLSISNVTKVCQKAALLLLECGISFCFFAQLSCYNQ